MSPASNPLYSHSLPEIEAWLTAQGGDRATDNISLWTFVRDSWSADLLLDVDSIIVRYTSADGSKVQRSFKYSLSRSDLEEVIFSGP
ncbi:MAG: Protein of unknown function (DUF3143) [Phormidesmis priestleyi Ana]|uniref:DUF3143 domain-containing protein n=1 Tax=Phormidesmis priestleyi Ana TaxID=1666911 RepID=A0A0N8KNP0_9CYAN|nr:MAG: Protein of unknown function (DUF3143) [Phormidesmis priestleyi Ana]